MTNLLAQKSTAGLAPMKKSILSFLTLAAPLPLWAALPTPVAPSTAPSAGDWLGLIQGYIKDANISCLLMFPDETEAKYVIMPMRL